jgi:signal peptidase I
MGDHRAASADSRAHQDGPGQGFVPVSDVVGRAFVIVWPLNRATLLHDPATFDQRQLSGAH